MKKFLTFIFMVGFIHLMAQPSDFYKRKNSADPVDIKPGLGTTQVVFISDTALFFELTHPLAFGLNMRDAFRNHWAKATYPSNYSEQWWNRDNDTIFPLSDRLVRISKTTNEDIVDGLKLINPTDATSFHDNQTPPWIYFGGSVYSPGEKGFSHGPTFSHVKYRIGLAKEPNEEKANGYLSIQRYVEW